MKARHPFSMVHFLGSAALLLALFSQALGARPASAATANAAPAGPRWRIVTVDAPGSVGRYASIAINPVSNQPWILYYDATNHDSKRAYPDPQGVCGANPATGWACSEPSATNVTGWYTSIDFNSDGGAGMAEYDDTNKLNRFTGDLCNGCAWFFGEPVDLSGTSGYFNSLKYDSGNEPHIAFESVSAGLRYASHVDSGGNGGYYQDWQSDTIDAGPNVGYYASLDIAVGDVPFIAYRGASGELKFARHVGSGGNCGPGNTWRCDVIDSTINAGAISLHANQCIIYCSDGTHIAYFDANNGLLKYAKFVGGNAGNCGFGSQLDDWQCSTIETVGNAYVMGVSLDVYYGNPVIAYQDANDQGNTILKIARPVVQPEVGNCGPGDLFLTWQCDVVDDGGDVKNVGQYTALALNSAGLAYIAYYDSSNADLKVAYQQFEVFVPLAVKP